MPGLSYQSRHSPPHFLDHVFSHAGAFASSLAAFIIGLMMLVTTVPGIVVAPAIEDLPWWAGVLVGSCLIFAGTFCPFAILHRVDDIETTRLLYSIGLVFHMIGWFGWGVALIADDGPTYWTAVVMAVTSVLNAIVELVGISLKPTKVPGMPGMRGR